MANKTTVVISRRWDGPMIKVEVTDTGINVSMSLEEFLESLTTEAGSPALLITTQALRVRLREAAERVVRGMKQETARVM